MNQHLDVQVIEMYTGAGECHWYISFNGPNPSSEECFRCGSSVDAFKLQRLIRDFVTP